MKDITDMHWQTISHKRGPVQERDAA
jgi:hypothetical protein